MNQFIQGLRSICLSAIWTSITIFFGLLQIWLLKFLSIFAQKYNPDISRILMDGSLLFFATALVSAIALDCHINRRVQLRRLYFSLLFTFIPIVFILGAVALYYLCMSSTLADINMDNLKLGEYALLICTVAYSLTAKSIQFFMEERN